MKDRPVKMYDRWAMDEPPTFEKPKPKKKTYKVGDKKVVREGTKLVKE